MVDYLNQSQPNPGPRPPAPPCISHRLFSLPESLRKWLLSISTAVGTRAALAAEQRNMSASVHAGVRHGRHGGIFVGSTSFTDLPIYRFVKPGPSKDLQGTLKASQSPQAGMVIMDGNLGGDGV